MGNMRLVHRAWHSIFQPAARYPVDPRAVFILMLSVFSGLVTLALETAPGSLEALLPRWGVVLWSVLLTGGSAITLLGMAFQSLNGIILEQIGSITVAVTTVFYSTLAIWVIGDGAFQSIGIILAWGLSCVVRWAQLQALIVSAYRKSQKAKFERAVEEAVSKELRQ